MSSRPKRSVPFGESNSSPNMGLLLYRQLAIASQDVHGPSSTRLPSGPW